ncbi:RidA family protein [Brachyspira pilosicoli]|uniref:RidA family protein n=1 Tax=Brachyspira pilosicoli TaxID=52584 RepID=A0A5C8FBM4_BRAPL|nr:Rid family detoxifying hydrolase [Brachyspira pilosicoli]TXJ46834.1 RidA family protein [Brachyspira pilosicoli]
MTKKKIEIHTDNSPQPAGPYSQCILAGDFVFVAGQRPENPITKEIPNDIKLQTKQCIENIKSILEEAGSSLENVVKSNVYLSDIKYFNDMNEIYSSLFPKPFPTRTTIGVNLRNILVEIEVMALRDKK